MQDSAEHCFRCGEKNGTLTERYGYVMCENCDTSFRVMRDETILKHVDSYHEARAIDPEHMSYEEEVLHKLNCLERDYITKKIHLLHIRDRLKELKYE